MKTSHKAGATGAGAIAICLTFTPIWEGMDLVAKRDMIGTGNPITYCNGMTSVDGTVMVGQRFTPEQCRALLAKALPKYWDPLEPCIKVDIPVQTAASLLDASLNAGPAAVCKSPMLAKINSGDIRGGCEAFSNWYITTKNHGARSVIPGLVNRRGGNPNEHRKTEKALCLEGLTNPPTPKYASWRDQIFSKLKGNLFHVRND